MSGFIEELDADQKAMLKQIRERLSDVLKEEHDDRFLLQFLRARSFNDEDTEHMLRTHLRWRKHFSIDYLMNDYKPPEFCSEHLNIAVLGFSNEGSLLRLFRLGYSDLKGVVMGNTSLDIETFLAYVLTNDKRLLKEHREQTGLHGETVIYIGDFDGLNVYELPWKYTLGLLIRLVRMFEENFPEHLKAVYLINCPTVMYYVLKALKPFMSEVTASKINICGKEGYKERILKDTSPEILPNFLGGTRRDTENDKICEYLNTKANKIPENSYFFHALRLNETQPGVVKVKVQRRTSHNIEIEVTDEDCAISYKLDIMENDLGVGLFFKENSDLKCLKPVKRFKGCFSPVVGMHVCEKPGKYVLMLDNRYSYFTDKDVLYKVKVEPPLAERKQ